MYKIEGETRNMIEKLKSEIGNIRPATEVVNLVKKLKNEREKLVVAEIGVGWGATAVELIKVLSEKDEYCCFDFDNQVNELYEDLNGININRVRLKAFGNSTKTYDSYAWNLAKMLCGGGKIHYSLI